MSSLRDRLRRESDPERAEGEAAPAPVVGPGHSDSVHTRRHEADMLDVWYGEGSIASLPYALLSCIDLRTPGKLVISFAGHVVTVEGIRLEPLRVEVKTRRAAVIRPSEANAPDDGTSPVVMKVMVKELA